MKLFDGKTVLCPEVREWDVKKYGYISYIMIIHNEKDDDGKYIDEIINGPFFVHHIDEENCSVTFARVDPDDEYVPDGFAVTIDKKILGSVMNVFICMMNTNIHLFPHTVTINPEILKIWEKCEADETEMYLKYHDPIVNKNMLVQVLNMFTRTMAVGFISDCEYQRRNLLKSEEDLNIDADVIVW
jgi:hypothetical protein